MKLQLKKNFTSIDLFGVVLFFGGSKYLYDAVLIGEIQIRAISIALSESPLLYWVSVFSSLILNLLLVFYLIFYDFKKQGYLLSCDKSHKL
ncbi:hypothetical protein [Pseudocolwellia sp. HL-MZ7]|uniref:hypothetical protein n=1 Tax=Pseudocolwellia sp. HL-MZ7 TaxID=3400627 RepID=UPI003CE8640F